MRIRMLEDVGDFITIGGRKVPTDTSGYRDNASYDEITRDFARKYDDDQKSKARAEAERQAAAKKAKEESDFAASIQDKLDAYETATNNYNKDNNTDTYIESLFDIFVPNSGTSETFGGEILRAICRLKYRFYNDGDMIISRTDSSADNAAGFICDVCDREPTRDIYYGLEEMGEAWDEISYERSLKKFISTSCNIFASHPELFRKKNNDDFLNHDLPDTFYNTEEVELHYDAFDEYQDGLVDNAWVDNLMESFADDVRYNYSYCSDVELKRGRAYSGGGTAYRLVNVPANVAFELDNDFYEYWNTAIEEEFGEQE